MIKFIACIILAVENLLLLFFAVATVYDEDELDRSEEKAAVILGMFFGLVLIFALCSAFVGGLT